MKGSVFKRCNKCGARVQERRCRKCGSDDYSWGYVVDVGTTWEPGERVQRKRSGFPKKQDAERALREILVSLDQRTYVEPTGKTLGEYLMGEWLPATAPPHVKFETWNDRRMCFEQYVISRIGDVELQKLNAAHFNRLYAQLLQEGRVRGGGGLSPTSVRRVHAMLRTALNDAMRWGLVQRNATELADPPPMRGVKAARRRSMKTWTVDELRRFLEHTQDHLLGSLWAVATATGLRRSELLGLRWADADLDSCTVTVSQTVLEGEEGHRPEEDQKSTTSARTIHLDHRTAELLRRHRKVQLEQRLEAGPAWQDHDLVFPQPDGTWYHPDTITSAFGRAVKTAGVPKIRLHDLRHTHATLLLKAGVNPKVVSERLGHSSVAFTLDTYSHVMPGMQPEAAELFMNLVLGEDEADDENPEEDADGAS